MNKLLITFLLISHLAVGSAGFALGVYLLPILIAPSAPTTEEINDISMDATYSAIFTRDLKDSDAFHWGEGKVFVGNKSISLMGKLAPGPDYRLYLAKEFVETEAKFKALKPQMVQVGNIDTFENFVVDVSEEIDTDEFNTVIVWCERFNEFITAAQYKD